VTNSSSTHCASVVLIMTESNEMYSTMVRNECFPIMVVVNMTAFVERKRRIIWFAEVDTKTLRVRF